MKPALKYGLMIAAMLAVIAYTIYNYAIGRSDPGYFLMAMVLMGIPLMNIINILIQQHRKK